MVKVEFGLLRYLEEEDFRCLVALEMCMRNHDVAPTVLIERIAQLPHGGARKRLNNLLKFKIIHHESLCYDGFCMKYAGYDFLALRTFVKRGTLTGIGTRVGCGKESDIMTVVDGNGCESVMKLQRLGRCSFRSVARNRDYKGGGKKRHGESWFYLSRLAATKEFAFMKLLYDEGFPVPKPIDHNRHAVVMERIDGTLLNHIQDMAGNAQKVYERILNLMVKLAQHGLIHGDFNEFNCFVTDAFKIVVIDFPQMVSTDHPNASELFDRDVNNLAAFFQRRHKIEKVYFPKLDTDVERTERFDQRVTASGAFTKAQQKELEMLMQHDAEEEEDDEEEEEEDDEAADAQAPGTTTSLLPDAPAAAAAAPAERGPRKGKHADPAAASAGLTIAALAARTAEKVAKPVAVVVAPGEAAAADDDEEDAKSNVSSNGPAPAGAAGDVDRAETRSVAPTIASTAATLAKRMLAKKRAENANFAGESAEIDKDHIWKRTKARATHMANMEFNQQMHRNSQKGKAKRRVEREIAGGEHPTTIYD